MLVVSRDVSIDGLTAYVAYASLVSISFLLSGRQCRPSKTAGFHTEPSPVPTEHTEEEGDGDDDECAEEWGQCGGIGWDGPTCCLGGIECYELSEWYHSCRPS